MSDDDPSLDTDEEDNKEEAPATPVEAQSKTTNLISAFEQLENIANAVGVSPSTSG